LIESETKPAVEKKPAVKLAQIEWSSVVCLSEPEQAPH